MCIWVHVSVVLIFGHHFIHIFLEMENEAFLSPKIKK